MSDLYQKAQVRQRTTFCVEASSDFDLQNEYPSRDTVPLRVQDKIKDDLVWRTSARSLYCGFWILWRNSGSGAQSVRFATTEKRGQGRKHLTEF